MNRKILLKIQGRPAWMIRAGLGRIKTLNKGLKKPLFGSGIKISSKKSQDQKTISSSFFDRLFSDLTFLGLALVVPSPVFFVRP